MDLPVDNGPENADAITLPEIFHNFENAVADLGCAGFLSSHSPYETLRHWDLFLVDG